MAIHSMRQSNKREGKSVHLSFSLLFLFNVVLSGTSPFHQNEKIGSTSIVTPALVSFYSWARHRTIEAWLSKNIGES